MRISDWSSDVCSSDLTDLYSRRAREDVSALCDPWGRPRRTAAGCGNRQGRDGGADRRCAALGAERSLVAAAAQIGRASCRERVCQYVSISVGAVSLKKQQHEVRLDIKRGTK